MASKSTTSKQTKDEREGICRRKRQCVTARFDDWDSCLAVRSRRENLFLPLRDHVIEIQPVSPVLLCHDSLIEV